MKIHRSVKNVNVAERELAAFVGFAAGLLGSEPVASLKSVWLDELASMETMPGPTSAEWRLVTVAATARLATRLLSFGHTPGGEGCCLTVLYDNGTL